MKLINSSFEIIEQQPGLEGIYKQIELAGRVSHKSEHLITEDSAIGFFDRIIKLEHGAVLEFGTIYLKIQCDTYEWLYEKYKLNPYSKINTVYLTDEDPVHYVTTNYRVLFENKWTMDLQYLCEPTEYHEKRYCVKFICSRDISHQLVRHRSMSLLQESQRYCLYSSKKYGNQITYIIPTWSNLQPGEYNSIIDGNNKEGRFHNQLLFSELCYMNLLDDGCKAEEARAVLPNATKTELYMCGFTSDWVGFFKLRDDKQHAHPDAYALAHPLHEEFIKRGYL